MKITDILIESDVKADPKIVDKFSGVSDSQRSYYIYQWAKEKGIDSDEAMQLAGYERGDYIGAGSYMWHYAPNESIEEAPAGMLKQIGRKIGAKAAGAIGMKGTAAKLGGAADAGKRANELKVKLQGYLGSTGGNIKQLDAQELSAFLKQQKLPTNSVPASGIVPPKALDGILMKTIQTSNKAAGAPIDAPSTDAPAASGGAAPQAAQQTQQPAAVDANKDGKDDKTGKVIPMKKPAAAAPSATTEIPADIQAQLDALTPTEKKVLAGVL
ncbi:MAG: hypothetical protein VW551_00220 [Euryarchaeota archaeon]